jgi:hypothetical protein
MARIIDTHASYESEGYWTTLRSMLLISRVMAAQVHDARVAALFIYTMAFASFGQPIETSAVSPRSW